MIGVDEVGRGCWAGPLIVVAARAFDELPTGLKDSKLLSKNQRQEMHELLISCCNFGEGWVRPVEIDRLGLSQALALGAKRALRQLGAAKDDELILDGKYNYLPRSYKNTSALINGDNIVPIISAASIYAKVTRDHFMTQLASRYPDYSFDRHVGYGTSLHRLALRNSGAIKSVHRYSFAPIASLSAS